MPNDLRHVDRTVLSMKACVEPSLGASALLRFEISVTEALVNLVKHATTSDAAAPIDIELHDADNAVCVEICDPVGAAPFDVRDHAPSQNAADPLAENGRGLGLIVHCTDHIAYGPKADRMCLSLTISKSGD
ncbi:ATP-binding protein [Yoonia sp. 208BN28-4]